MDNGGNSGDEEADAVLVARAGAGDRIAAAMLVNRHSPRILGLCTRMLGDRSAAEDAAQETFMKLWEHAGRWRPQGVRFEAWLCRVASNACLDRLRKRGREVPDDNAEERPDDAPNAEYQLVGGEIATAVEAALAGLPERQRLAVTLCHYQGLTNIEAAQVMDVSVDALESLLARGRRALKESLSPLRADLLEGVR